MHDFDDIFLGESYLEPYCAMIGSKGLVFVEGLKDISFWDGFLNKDDKEDDFRYSINYASHEGTRGKTVLKKFYSFANRFAIFAIDSDFDYICPNNNEAAKIMNSNKHIIQTLVYSKESISLHHLVLSDCINKIRITDSISFPIKEYMESYSKTIYETLINFLFKKEMGINVSDSDFHEKITPEKPVIDKKYHLTNNPFHLLSQTKDANLNYYKDHSFSGEDFEKFRLAAIEKGLDSNSAAYFISGHFLEEKVVMPLITEIVSKFKLNELERIKAECKNKPQLIEDNRRELYKYIDNEISFSNILHSSKAKYETPFSLELMRKNQGL